jgi:hypothetical protein
MNVNKLVRSIRKVVAEYRAFLNALTEEQFQLTPPIGGWSYSEVYSHIFDASILSEMAATYIRKGKGKEAKTVFLVRVILFFGQLPPARKYKAPSSIAGRVKKISKVEALDYIDRFLALLDENQHQYGLADPKLKTKHPVMGYLNSVQWIRFIEIHLKHHLKQLKRIKESFKISKT